MSLFSPIEDRLRNNGDPIRVVILCNKMTMGLIGLLF